VTEKAKDVKEPEPEVESAEAPPAKEDDSEGNEEAAVEKLDSVANGENGNVLEVDGIEAVAAEGASA